MPWLPLSAAALVTSGLRRPVQAQARGGMVRVPLLVERALLQGVPALVKA